MILFIIIFTLLLNGLLSANPLSKKEIDIKTFCHQYDFHLKYQPNRDEITLTKGNNKYHFQVNSRVVFKNNKEIFILKKPIKRSQGIIYLSPSFISKILNQKPLIASKNLYNPPIHQSNHKIHFVILDAGHGGKDPGNTHHGLEEKNINLVITKKVLEYLKRELPNVKIYLTRSGDQYLSLEERSLKAVNLTSLNNNGIFISIHANASLNPSSRGLETFFYSSKATNEPTERINCFERLTSPLTSHPVAHKIISKMYDLQISRESKFLAQYIHKSVFKRIKAYTPDRGIKAHQPYFVITHNNLPSILIEVGFLTQRDEAQNLNHPKYHNKIAEGITEGISLYINKFNKTNGFMK